MLYIKSVLLFISGICILWGGLITFSERYFTYWQNAYWKEEGNRHWSEKSIRINRWGKGFGALIFGIALVYIVLFIMS